MEGTWHPRRRRRKAVGAAAAASHGAVEGGDEGASSRVAADVGREPHVEAQRAGSEDPWLSGVDPWRTEQQVIHGDAWWQGWESYPWQASRAWGPWGSHAWRSSSWHDGRWGFSARDRESWTRSGSDGWYRDFERDTHDDHWRPSWWATDLGRERDERGPCSSRGWGTEAPSWYNEAPVDESLEFNPAAWPPGEWEHHRLDGGDTDDEPNTQGAAPMVSTPETTTKTVQRKIPSTYPPSFSATPSESYLEWKRSVQCWIAGEGGQLPEDVMGPRCLSVLKGRASVIVRHLKIEEVSKPGGLDLVFKALEASPMVKELDGQRGERAQREFLRCRRQGGESMESFLMRVQAQRAVMEEEDDTFAVGDRFLVGYILDNAELTLKDRVMVLAAAQNKMSSEYVFPALRRMGPFLQGTVSIGKGVVDAPLLPELQPDHQPAAKNGGDGQPGRKPWGQQYRAHVALDETGCVEEAPPEEEGVGELDGIPEELEAATHAAMAAYSSSQAKLKALKQARGYFKKPEPAAQPDRKERLRLLMKENPCRACGQYGHWSKDPECPKNQKNAAVMSTTSSSAASMSMAAPPATPEGDNAAMSAVLEQMLKEQQAQSARVYMAAACVSDSRRDFVTLANASCYDELLTGRMVVDIGCLRTVAGTQWVLAEIARCKQQGRYVEIQRAMDYFRFGDGERRPSKFRIFMEVGLCGHVGLLAINAVEYPCPPLLSKRVCTALGLLLDCGSGRYDMTKLGVKAQHFVTSADGHFLVSISTFLEHNPTWQDLRAAGHTPKIQHEEVQMFELRDGRPVGKGARKVTVGPSGDSHATSSSTGHGSASSAADCHSLEPRGFGAGLGGGRGRAVGNGGRLRGFALPEGGARNPPGCLNGVSADRVPRTEGARGAQAEVGLHQELEQEREEAGDHGAGGGFSHLGHDAQSGCGLQHVVGDPRALGGLQVEAADVDAASQAGHGALGLSLEAAPPLDGYDVQQGSGQLVGAPGVSVPNTLRAPRASVDEVSGGSSMRPKSTSERGSEKPWSRGQVQLLKQGVRHVREAIAALTMVAKQDSVPHYRVLEIFGGSAALSLVHLGG